MTNEQKYKTTEERVNWLALESEEKPKPCPFCGGTTEVITDKQGYYGVSCIHCDYTSERYEQSIYAIAAHNRVCRAVESATKQAATDCNHLGNAAKMREALKTISKCDISKEEDCISIYRVCEAALAVSPRNCDVGTVEEQAERFHSFCESNKQCGDVYSCERCQLNSIEDCELAWAQMPYEEGGTK